MHENICPVKDKRHYSVTLILEAVGVSTMDVEVSIS